MLYDGGDTGTKGTVTLSQSAANFDHMRIYYRSNAYSSVDVYSPNGKRVSLPGVYSLNSNYGLQFQGRDVLISGTSISTMATDRYYDASIILSTKSINAVTSSNELYI